MRFPHPNSPTSSIPMAFPTLHLNPPIQEGYSTDLLLHTLSLQFILKYELPPAPDPSRTPIFTEPITKTPTETRMELVIALCSENRSESRETITKKPRGVSGNPYSEPREAISVRSGSGKGVRGPLRKALNHHAHAI